MIKISDHIYGFLTSASFMNYYLILNGDDITLIDTGWDDSIINHLEKAFVKEGWGFHQIKHILITHAHYDHVGGLPALQAKTNAHTAIHRLDAPIARGEKAPVYEMPENLGFFNRLMLKVAQRNLIATARIDTELNGDETLDHIIPGLKAVHLPGHSYGQTGFWLPHENVLIGGDVVMNLPWGISHPFRMVSPDWVAVKESIRKVADIAPQILCVGHGPIIRGNIPDRVKHLV